MCIIDGMSDDAFRREDYRYLSKMTAGRRIDTCMGCRPETLTCTLHILGVSTVPAGLRAYVEALGAGVEIYAEDLLLRGSRYTADKAGHLLSPCDEKYSEGFSAELASGAIFKFHPIGGYKSILVFPGAKRKIGKIKTFPPSGGSIYAKAPEGFLALKEAFDYLKDDDSCVIPWGESFAQKLELSKESLYLNPEKSTLISGTTIVRGIGRLLGIKSVYGPGFTGDTDTNLFGKLEAALESAQRCETVILHINGADEAGHRKDSAEKRAFLKKVDEIVIRGLLESPYDIEVVSDHGTDPVTGSHTGELQPFFFRNMK